MDTSFPGVCMAVAVAGGTFATTLGLLDRWDAAGAVAAAVAALAAGTLGIVCGGRRTGPAGSAGAFLARAVGWTAAAFAVLAPGGWLLGKLLVAITWEDPHHSQAGLFALLVGLWYGGAWAPAVGVWRARRPRGEGA